MKVLIFGSKGWIGNQVIELLNKMKIFYIVGEQRAEDIKELEKEIQEIQPTHRK